MAGANFSLTGTENILKMFREFHEEGYRKPMNISFRKAAEPVKRAMIANLPANLKVLKKIVKIKSSRKSKGEPSVAVGFFNNQGMTFRNKKGVDWDPFQIAFWHNYGTMANRSADYSFKTGRKTGTANRKGGIKPLHFAEKGWEQGKDQAQRIFEETADKEMTKFFETRAYK